MTHAPPAMARCMVQVLAGDDARHEVVLVHHDQVPQAQGDEHLQSGATGRAALQQSTASTAETANVSMWE